MQFTHTELLRYFTGKLVGGSRGRGEGLESLNKGISQELSSTTSKTNYYFIAVDCFDWPTVSAVCNFDRHFRVRLLLEKGSKWRLSMPEVIKL